MEEVVDAILVRDEQGDEVTLYEYQEFVPHLTSLGLLRGAGNKRLVLDTGEKVSRVDQFTFVIVATGEKLSRIY